MMSKLRALATLISAAIGITSAFAQFQGPAPLAWRWFQPTQASPSGSPAIDGDTIYVASGQRMYALNREDGNQRWRYPAGGFLDTNFKGTPALANGLVIASTMDRSLYALDAATGKKVWTYIAPASILGSPKVSGNLVLFQMSDGIMAVTLDKGEPFYKTPIYLKDGIQGDFNVWKDEVLIFSSLNTLYAINVASQQVEWKQQTAGVSLNATVEVTPDTLYFVSNNYLIALNPGDGQMKFSTEVDDELTLAPAVTKKYVLAVSREGKAYVFTADGQRLKGDANAVVPPIDLKSPPLIQPVGLDGDVFAVATVAGTIELIDPKKVGASNPDQGLVWNYPIRPIGGIQEVNANQLMGSDQNNGQPGAGKGLGGPGGGSGFGGGQFGQSSPGGGGLQGGPGGSGNINRGGPSNGVVKIITIQAAGAPVLDKTTLLVLGRDGSLLAFDRNTGIDLTPPKVTMTYPNPGDMVSCKPPLELVFKLEDEASGVNESTLQITVDGQPVEFTLNKEGVAIVVCSETGKNHFSDGKKQILVTVSDWMGNVAKVPFTLVIDNDLPPVQPVPDNNQNRFGGGKGPGGFGAAG